MADTSITREEKYLEYLTGNRKGNVPKPVTRRERYLYELCLNGMGGEISPEEIKAAVNEYLEKNPVKPGATTEQAQQIEQNKTDIASLKVETGSLKEDISNKITKFYASSQGETHLADSDNGKIQDMMLYGKSEQKQYSGKNLVDASKVITGDLQEGIVANGNNYITDYVEIDDSEEYIISGCLKSNYENAFYDENKQFTRRDFNYTIIPQKGEKYVRIEYVNNGDKKIMLEKGSEATSYEPYTGGIPSPNPDYPQEILAVKNPTVKVCGKNLLELPISNKSTQAGITFEVINNSVIKITGINDGSRVSQYIAYNSQEVKYAKLIPYKNIAITISTYNNDVIAGLAYWLKSENYATVHYKQNKRKCTIDLGEDAKIVPWFFVPQNGIYTNDIVKFGVYYGTDELAYDAPKSQTVTLPYTLNAIPVSSGGNVTIDGQQYIADYVDAERGKLVRHIKEKSDTISIAVAGSVGGLGSYDYDIPFIKNVICNITNIVYEDINQGWASKQACLSGSNAGELRVYLPVGNHNVKIIYELETPEEIDLTPEEIAAFKALATYYPTTNISINSEQLDGYTVFNYPISMENGWNYVKQQIGDTRDYIYDMDARTQDTDLQAAEAYVNSEYAVALTELEV